MEFCIKGYVIFSPNISPPFFLKKKVNGILHFKGWFKILHFQLKIFYELKWQKIIWQKNDLRPQMENHYNFLYYSPKIHIT